MSAGRVGGGARPAVLSREGEVTYSALAARAGSISAEVVRQKAQPGDRVVVFLERGADAVASYFATLAAGCIVTIANERSRPRQLEHVLRDSGARVLISSATLLEAQHRSIETDAAIIDVERMAAVGEFAPVERRHDEVAQLIYTSGSTGLPRGVAFTHGALDVGVDVVATYLGLCSDDRLAALLPFSSVYGLNQVLGAVHVGASLIVERSPVPNQLVAQLRAFEATVLAAVPPLWLQLLGSASFTHEVLPSLRIVQNAGGHLPTEAVRSLRRAQPQARLFLQYGMTETFRSTFLTPEEVDARPGSMGKAMPGSEVLVLREDQTVCEPDEVGELVFQGPSIAAGYWNDAESTERTFRRSPVGSSFGMGGKVVFSGDMVRRDGEGFLYFVGRRDRMIKSLGYRIGPDEIVDVLHASGEIHEAVVTSEADSVRGERIVAYVVLAAKGSVEALKRFCGAELPRHMQPARIEARESLPRLVSGKYDLTTLAAPIAEQPNRARDS